MATKKAASPIKSIGSVGLKVTGVNVIKLRDVIGKFLVMQKITSFLSIVFYVIWILVGLFFLWFIAANFRLGAFDQLMQPRPTASSQVPQADQAPEETTVPGVGTVNVSCVQANLGEDLIIKMVQDKGIQNFSDEEKAKLAPCIVEAESPSDSTQSPSQ